MALLDIDLAAAERVAADCPDSMAIACDVADDAQVDRAVAQAAGEFGGIDILINNAGLHSAAFNKGFAELPLAEVRRLFDVNIMGVIHCTLAARAAMVGRGAAVLNIASIAGWGCTTSYGVSKLAVRGLTVAFAHELAGDGIRVNAVAPGLIATDTIRQDFPSEFFERFANDLQKVHRTGAEEDVVAAMLYLCSPEASFVTGETLRVSGGYPLTL